MASILFYNPGLDCLALQVGQYICLDSAGATVPTIAPISTTSTAAPIPTIVISTPQPTTAAPTTAAPTTTAAPGTLPAGCLDEFRKAALAAHNTYRAAHSAQSMVDALDVDKTAQAYADQLAATGVFAHSTNRVNTGENLAMVGGRPTTAAQCAGKLNKKKFLIYFFITK